MQGRSKNSVELREFGIEERLKPDWPEPYQTFDGVDLYPTIAGKAAALMEAIIIRHPWVDGNKRTGLGLALFLLMKEGYFVNASQQELYDITIKVAEGRSNAEEIQKWFEKRLKSI